MDKTLVRVGLDDSVRVWTRLSRAAPQPDAGVGGGGGRAGSFARDAPRYSRRCCAASMSDASRGARKVARASQPTDFPLERRSLPAGTVDRLARAREIRAC